MYTLVPTNRLIIVLLNMCLRFLLLDFLRVRVEPATTLFISPTPYISKQGVECVGIYGI